MMPFSRGRRGEMGLCIRQQSIPEKLIPPEAENGREQKKRGKCREKMDRSIIRWRSSAIFSSGREYCSSLLPAGRRQKLEVLIEQARKALRRKVRV